MMTEDEYGQKLATIAEVEKARTEQRDGPARARSSEHSSAAQRRPDSRVSRVADLLADGEPHTRSELMRHIGVSTRQALSDALTNARVARGLRIERTTMGGEIAWRAKT